MYFLKKLVILNMITKILFRLFLFLFIYQYSYSNVIYEKNGLIITEIDIKIYQQLYKKNYNLDINNTNSLRDLVLIKNLINNLKKNNPEFINKIDSEILIQFSQVDLSNNEVKDFYRFSRIRDEFIIDYFNNRLKIDEVKNIFNRLNNLNLPVSVNNCLIVKEVIDLKDNDEFIENFIYNLKNNSVNFQITIEKVKHDVCIDELRFKSIENLIVNYIQSETSEDFEKFVYDKTKN